MATVYGPDVDVAMTIAEWPEWGQWDGFSLFLRVIVSNGPYSPNDQTNPNLMNGYSLLLLDWSPVTMNHTVRAQLFRHDNGTPQTGLTAIGSSTDILVSDGDAFGLRMVGSTLTAYRKPVAGSWTQILTGTDATYSAAGFAGFYMPGCQNPGTFSHPGKYDDFIVGTLLSAGTFPVPAVVDDFTRADEASLGPHWEGFIQQGTATGGMSAGILSNQAYNTDFTLAGDHFWSYLYAAGSERNLLTGLSHTVEGSDNLIGGQSNAVTGNGSEAHGFGATVNANRSVLFAQDGSPHTLSDDKVFEVYADEIRLHGLLNIAIDDTVFWPAAVFDQGGVYAPLWNSNGDATAPAYISEAGSNLTAASLEFVDTGTNQIFQTCALPLNWSGPMDLRIFWKCTPTSGNVVWQVQTAAITIGGTFDPAWNTAQTVTAAAQGTSNRFNVATISGLTLTGLVAGGWLAFRIVRDPSHASDTLGASAFFLGAELKFRRSLA